MFLSSLKKHIHDNAVVRNFHTTASDGKSYNMTYYNLDMTILRQYHLH